MPTINNTQLLKGLRDKAKILNLESVPSQLAEKIVPVLDVNPERLIKVKEVAASDAASQQILVTSTVKDTFLVGLSISLSKDIVNDSILTNIDATPFGSAQLSIFRLRYEPTTAQDITKSIIFPLPIKLERGTAIIIDNNTATASIDHSLVIYYYEVD